jgi:hypothetical protein
MIGGLSRSHRWAGFADGRWFSRWGPSPKIIASCPNDGYRQSESHGSRNHEQLSVSQRKGEAIIIDPPVASPRSSTSSLHPGGLGVDDHPFASALLKDIHPNRLVAALFTASHAGFADPALDHRNIAQYLHVHRSNLKGLKFVPADVRSLRKLCLVKISPVCPRFVQSPARI